MAKLVWDQVGTRIYETGLDRGVLYLPDGSAVPWNGLTSIIEAFDRETSPVYYDGMKIQELVSLGSFSASMKAVTYPEEFIEIEGLDEIRGGFLVSDQPPQTFGLCYRTRVGNDIEGDEVGYKIHILYNVTAIPNEKTYASLTSDPSLVEFEWEISAIPEEVPKIRPTAHIIIDTTNVDPVLLEELELILYGDEYVDAALIPMAELVQRVRDFLRFEVFDNGDGTWTITTELDELVELLPGGYFDISGIDAWHLDADTYSVSTTRGEPPQIKIFDLGDGSFTVTTVSDAFLFEVSPGMVEIYEATVVYLNDTTYELSDTP